MSNETEIFEERKKKQTYLRSSIIENGFDGQEFSGTNIDNWTLEELKEVVVKFIIKKNPKELEEPHKNIEKPIQEIKKNEINNNENYDKKNENFGRTNPLEKKINDISEEKINPLEKKNEIKKETYQQENKINTNNNNYNNNNINNNNNYVNKEINEEKKIYFTESDFKYLTFDENDRSLYKNYEKKKTIDENAQKKKNDWVNPKHAYGFENPFDAKPKNVGKNEEFSNKFEDEIFTEFETAPTENKKKNERFDFYKEEKINAPLKTEVQKETNLEKNEKAKKVVDESKEIYLEKKVNKEEIKADNIEKPKIEGDLQEKDVIILK